VEIEQIMQKKQFDYDNQKTEFESKLKFLINKMQEDLLYGKYEYGKVTEMLQDFID
jgi:hypothetical protein